MRLIPHSRRGIGSALILAPLALTAANYGSVRRVYIRTTQDKAITPWLQQLMIDGQPCDAVYSMNTDHSPFFSKPKALTKLLKQAADA